MVKYDSEAIKRNREKIAAKIREILPNTVGKTSYVIKCNPDCPTVINIWRVHGNPIFIQDMLDMMKVAEEIHPLEKKFADINWWHSEEGYGVSFQIVLEEEISQCPYDFPEHYFLTQDEYDEQARKATALFIANPAKSIQDCITDQKGTPLDTIMYFENDAPNPNYAKPLIYRRLQENQK